MRNAFFSFALGALVACSPPEAEPASSAEAPLSSVDALTQLWNARQGELAFGAPPVTVRGSFMTLSFWANEGERVQIHVDGALFFDVRRVKGMDWCKEVEYRSESVSEVTTVASDRTDVTVDVARSGIHLVVIGSPISTDFITARVSAAIRRRPATKNVRAVSMHNAKTCAVLSNGDAKCWGTTSSGWDKQPRSGTTIASMGAALAKAPLPSKAADVVLYGPGEFTTTSFLLEDGSVWSSFEDDPLAPLPLAGKAKKLTGRCALLEDDSLQCRDWYTGQLGAPIHYAKPPMAVDSLTCALLEGDELQCGSDPPAHLELDAGEHALDLADHPSATCILTNKAVRCGTWTNGVQTQTVIHWIADVPGQVVQFMVNDSFTPFLVTTDGVYSLTRDGDWSGPTHWDRDSDYLRFKQSRASRMTVTDSVARATQCVIAEGGVLQCAGAVNVGQLGLGDCINREFDEQLGANLPGLLLE